MSSPLTVLEVLAFVFVGAVGIGLLCVVTLFIIDRVQTQDAIRRNYPVIGRFRKVFSTLGEFFRQYFFAMDREELPFNRAQRDWVKRTGEPHSNTVAFGSTRNLSIVGTPIFVNAAFPPLDDQFGADGDRGGGTFALHGAVVFQHFGHELWSTVAACRARAQPGGG